VAVQASLYENVGGVIESLMVECPTVATSVGGMVDCVIDGETGILVRPADPADLARGVKAMLADRARARELAALGRRFMEERFSLARTSEDLNQLYRSERAASRRGFYNPVVTVGRCMVGIPILAWFVVRVAYRDFYLPSHWPTHRLRVVEAFDKATRLDTYWRPPSRRFSLPPSGRFSSMPLRIRWANRRVTAGLTIARWRIEAPMYAGMYRLHAHARWHRLAASIRGPVTTARFRLVRWRVEAPMYVRMYRHQLASWVGERAPGWGILRRLANLTGAVPSKGASDNPSRALCVEPPVRDQIT